MKRLILFIFVVLLFGCSNDEANSIPEDVKLANATVEKLTINEQEFEIIPTYHYFLDYISEQKGSNTNKEVSFNNHVVKPLSQEIYGNSVSLDGNMHFITPNKIRNLYEYMVQLDEKHREIISLIEEGLKDSTDILSGVNLKIYLIPYNPDIGSLEMEGVAGFADDGVIVLQIDPNVLTKDSLKYALAHEYHHAIYFELSDYKIRKHHLLDLVIMEGRADAFTKTVYPNYTAPWIEPLSPKSSEIVLEYIKEYKNSYDQDHLTNLHLGSRIDGLPQWSNYKIGFQIMENFIMQHPDMTVEEWTVLRADEIMKGTEEIN